MKHFKHNFRGYSVHLSVCNVYVHTEDDNHYVLFENIGEGTSVTNASEQLASEITKSLALDPEKCRFFETYREFDNDSFDEITYQWKDGVAQETM